MEFKYEDYRNFIEHELSSLGVLWVDHLTSPQVRIVGRRCYEYAKRKYNGNDSLCDLIKRFLPTRIKFKVASVKSQKEEVDIVYVEESTINKVTTSRTTKLFAKIDVDLMELEKNLSPVEYDSLFAYYLGEEKMSEVEERYNLYYTQSYNIAKRVMKELRIKYGAIRDTKSNEGEDK